MAGPLVVIVGPGVHVPAAVCARIDRALLDALGKARQRGVAVDPDAAAVIAEVSEVADRWRAAAAAATVDRAAGGRAPCPTMTTAAAAARLGVTPNRVRQLLRAGALPGRRDRHGRWQVGSLDGA